MRRTTRSLVIAALMTALSVVMLYIASLLPFEQLGIIALSSLFGIAAVIETGLSGGVLVFIGSAIIGALIIPSKPMIHYYVLFFGYYPVVKSLAEKIKYPILKWSVKLAVFNGALSALWFLFSSLIFNQSLIKLGVNIIYLAGNAVFIAYDLGLSRLISFYIIRISKNIRKNSRVE